MKAAACGLAPCALLPLAVAAVYANVRQNPFLFDDLDIIVRNPHLRSWKGVPALIEGLSCLQVGARARVRSRRALPRSAYVPEAIAALEKSLQLAPGQPFARAFPGLLRDGQAGKR
ncbi:MAG: hypothetical protein KGL10_07030 [Alphaproteobacteria bacterium]|nr:hypothetical protein [Alphaproteobacteria bacterium]